MSSPAYSSSNSSIFQSLPSSSDFYFGDSMSGLTPIRTGTASSQLGTTEQIQKALDADFVNAIYQNVSVVTFVQIVWGLDTSDTEMITGNALNLRVDSLAKYKEILSAKGQYEPELHQPFREMARALLKDICRLSTGKNLKLLTYFWDGLGKATLHSKASTSDAKSRTRKPDLLEVFIPEKDGHLTLDPDEVPIPTDAPKPGWSEVRAAVEFKRKKQSPLVNSISNSESPIHSRDGNEGASLSTVSDLSQSGSSDDGSPGSTTTSPLASGKRLRSSKGDSLRQLKRIRVGATKNELQLATYALESLYEGNRHYTTGFLIDGVNVNIWYYDRTAAMRCVPFDFTTIEGIKSLALSLFALSQCNMKQAGFDPYLYRFTSPPKGEAITAGHVAPLNRPTTDSITLCYKFPGADELVFVIKEILSRYRGINGRGTLVSVVNKGVIGHSLSDTDYILKLSWQERTRTHEGDIISKIRAAIPGWCNYLPDPIFHTRIAATEIELPRTRMRKILLDEGRTDEALALDDRDIHALVTNRFEKLRNVGSVKEFKCIFLDCLECHYHAWNTAKVLHRDISESNLMVYRPGAAHPDQLASSDTMPDRKGKGKVETIPSRGILNDFDMSSELGPDGNIQLNAKPHHHITGTLPFMARDLLSQVCNGLDGAPPKLRYETNGPTANYHFYRYDLESFYYVLIWAAITYKFPRRGHKSHKAMKETQNPLRKWLSPDPETVYVSKVLLYTGPLFKTLDDSVSKEWKGLWDDWIKPLQLMFGEGLSAADAALRHGDANFDTATCNGLITFERFMDTIKETPRGLNPTHV